METTVSHQAAALLAAFLTGFCLGLFYDILRPIRRHCGRFGAAAIDFCFSLVSAFLMFVYSMGAPSCRLGIWELAFSAVGFIAYLYTLSDPIFSFTQKTEVSLARICKQIKNNCRKYLNSAKKVFKKMIK